MRQFYFVQGDKRVHQLMLDDSVGSGALVAAALAADPLVVDASDFLSVRRGHTYVDGRFYSPEGALMATEETPDVLHCAIVVENTVQATFTYKKTDVSAEHYDAMAAILTAKTSVVGSTEEVRYGYQEPLRLGGCLVGSTLVAVPEGYREAQHLQVGDPVRGLALAELSEAETVYTISSWSSNTATPVERYVTKIDGIKVMKVSNQYVQINDEDKYSADQLVLVKRDGRYRFLPAHEIRVGDQLSNADATQVDLPFITTEVRQAETHHEYCVVYLFSTERGDVLLTKLGLVHNLKL